MSFTLSSHSQVLVTFSETNGGDDTLMIWSGSFDHDVVSSSSQQDDPFYGNFSNQTAWAIGDTYAYTSVIMTSDAGALTSQNAYGYSGGLDVDLTSITGSTFGQGVGSGSSYHILWGTDDTTTLTSGSCIISSLSITELYATSWSVNSISETEVHFTAVPEPSTYAAIFGALSLGFVVYRKKKLTQK